MPAFLFYSRFGTGPCRALERYTGVYLGGVDVESDIFAVDRCEPGGAPFVITDRICVQESATIGFNDADLGDAAFITGVGSRLLVLQRDLDQVQFYTIDFYIDSPTIVIIAIEFIPALR